MLMQKIEMECQNIPEGAFVVREEVEDGHAYVRVTNSNGDHLFSAGSFEMAERLLTKRHNIDVATCWNNPQLAPRLNIVFIPLENNS